MATDSDYSVYEGSLGVFSAHTPLFCSTGNLPATTLVPAEGDRYYLIVAHDEAHEGSYGSDSSGISRAPGPVQCLPTAATTTCP